MVAALIVIDVQEGLFRPTPSLAMSGDVFSRVNELTSRARAASVPVIFVQHETATGDLEYGSPGWALAKELHVRASDQIRLPSSHLGSRMYSPLRPCRLRRSYPPLT